MHAYSAETTSDSRDAGIESSSRLSTTLASSVYLASQKKILTRKFILDQELRTAVLRQICRLLSTTGDYVFITGGGNISPLSQDEGSGGEEKEEGEEDI